MMTNKRWTIGILATAFSLVASTPALADDGDPVPVLILEEEQAETPQPVCEICAIVAAEDAEESSSATVTLTHIDPFEGDVEMVLWLESDEQVTVWIEDVVISEGLLDVSVESGAGWSWKNVRYAWARYHSSL